ncbi:MAG: DNA repair protein RadC [Mogibacterium sp.]|nr:DNA repair protein RadC [Mogibacterium sp.]
MHIKDLPVHERPQEKLMYLGAQALSTSELLALIIRTGSAEKSAIQLAEDVLSYTTSEVGSLRQAKVPELTALEGIGISKACSILASVELGRRLDPGDKPSMFRMSAKNDQEVARIMMEELRYQKQEHVIALLVNAKMEIESRALISVGELSSAYMNPREVFAPAIRHGAAGIIMIHNHPSGNPSPSEEDLQATFRLEEAAAILRIKLLDHLIIGDGSYVSLRAEGYLRS